MRLSTTAYWTLDWPFFQNLFQWRIFCKGCDSFWIHQNREKQCGVDEDSEIVYFDGSSPVFLTNNSVDDNAPEINGFHQVAWSVVPWTG